jgi:hypothetical protein
MEIISQFFGIFFGSLAILGALSVAVNGFSWRSIFGEIESNHSIILLAATLDLFIGLLVITLHPYYQLGWPIIITIIGWMAIIEAITLFLLPSWVIQFSRWSNTGLRLHSWALVSFVVGVFLFLGVFGIL